MIIHMTTLFPDLIDLLIIIGPIKLLIKTMSGKGIGISTPKANF